MTSSRPGRVIPKAIMKNDTNSLTVRVRVGF